MKKITVIGGGTGAYVVLSGLKNEDVDLGVIVNMTDSGGSTGKLRDQLGVLPPGDLRQCLVALSDAPILWRKLFLYRFETGDFDGHNFGNIFLSALEKVSSGYQEVVETASYVLKTKGKVIPVTFGKSHLCVRYANGHVIKGEGNIDEDNKETARIEEAYLEPKVPVNDEAAERLAHSDLIIISPGDLYTSIIPVLLVPGVRESILSSKAKIVYVLNLMTKAGQTTNYKASDHVADLKKYLGREPDCVLVNSGDIPDSILEWYLTHSEKPVLNDLGKQNYGGTVTEAELTDRSETIKGKSDRLTRSILRHDSAALANVIMSYAGEAI